MGKSRFYRWYFSNILSKYDAITVVSDYLAHNQATNLFKEFGLRGDYIIFSDACSAGASAIGYSFNSVRLGHHDIALCGGYDTMSEFTFAGFNSLMAMTPEICRPFDKNRVFSQNCLTRSMSSDTKTIDLS